MGRRGTWLVGIAVAVIAVAAIVDALRGDGEPTAASQPRPTTSTSTKPRSVSRPVAGGVPGGVLYYTDDDCTLKAARLPSLEQIDAPGWRECHFVLSPDATSVSAPPSGWDPVGDFLFRVDKGWVLVTSQNEPFGERVAGTAAAWRPDATLTYVADGTVREWPGGRVLLSQDDLAEAVRAHPLVPDHGHVLPVKVRELGWLDDEHAVVILEASISGPRQTLLAIYESHRLVGMHFEDGSWLSDLRVSPRGGFIGLRSGDAFLLLNGRGDTLPAPLLTGYRAVAWSADDRWIAAATRRETVFFRTGETSIERRLPLVARDLTWRASSGSTLAQDSEALAGVASLGATGRLLVTLPDSGGCVLSALELPSLEWAEHPPGNPNPCRFAVDEDDEILSDSAVPQPGGSRVAGCTGRTVDVFNDEGFLAEYREACAPAWMPDGQLTFIRNGGLFQPARRLLSRREVSRLMGRPSALEEVAWLDDELFWAVVRSGRRATVALMSTDRLLSTPLLAARMIEGLRAGGTMVAARTEKGVVFVDASGTPVFTVPNGQAIAWEPGGQLAAVATEVGVLILSPASRRTVTLPLGARDVEWVRSEN
jgi:hypothetical protein